MEEKEFRNKYIEILEIKAKAQVIIENCMKKLKEIRRKYHEIKNVRN